MLKLEHSYLDLPASLHAVGAPEPASEPRLVFLNRSLAAEIGLDLDAAEPQAWARLLAGAELPADARPFSQAYAGHQFGHFTNLGDGRAIVLGEWRLPSGQSVDVQLKGSGRTPYSRRGDGKAALGPMIREYLISEAMHGLRIPTTRSLAVVATGETVFRETPLPGAVLTRIAASHLRVGTFEYASAIQEPGTLEALVSYALARHYPDRLGAASPALALALLDAVIDRQTRLIVEWMRVGFIHGVMNTDNMTISGETIDYGPCAFMDEYDPMQTFSSIDEGRRYAFSRQPVIAQWNLARFAEALLPVLDPDQPTALALAQARIGAIGPAMQSLWLAMMGRKIGLADTTEDDRPLIDDLLQRMHEARADYTNTFTALGNSIEEDAADAEPMLTDWRRRWRQRLARSTSPETARDIMGRSNPVYIPRNHLVEAAIAAAHQGDLTPANELLAAMAEPYVARQKFDALRRPPAAAERVLATFCGT